MQGGAAASADLTEANATNTSFVYFSGKYVPA
jgi:hypothetical protein